MMARARNLANAHLFFGSTDEVNKELSRYLSVKREDLQRVAKLYLDEKKVHVVHYAVPESPAAPGAPPGAKPSAPEAKPADKKSAEQSEEDLRKRKRAVAPRPTR